MKIGVVNKNDSFAKHWITYLESNETSYSLVDPYKSTEVLKKLDFLFWHVDHFNHRDIQNAQKIIGNLSEKVNVFPNMDELNYYDNKIKQIELFRSLNIKHPDTFISNNIKEAKSHIEMLNLPFVAKLKKGAGSDNVWLIQSKKEALLHIRKAFSEGFSVFNAKRYLKKRIQKAKDQNSIKQGIKGIRGVIKNRRNASKLSKERGYTFFQEFIPNDGYDIRVVVINEEKAFSARRDAKKNGWAASGSGIASYPNENVDISFIKEAYKIACKMNARCIAIDLVKHKDTEEIFTIEISPFYASYSMEPCTGYWDRNLKWHFDKRDPQWFLIDKMIESEK